MMIKRNAFTPIKNYCFLVSWFLLTVFATGTKAQNVLQLMNAEVLSGQEVTISLHINNTSQFVGFQLDIPVPEAFSYVAGSAILNPARSNGHLFSASFIDGNSTLRIISFSINNTPFIGNSGEVANFRLLAGTVPGSYPLTINNALIADAGSNNIMTSVINATLTLRAPNIHVTPESHDFGSNPLGTYADRVVNILNTGNLPLNVTALSFESGYFENLGSNSFTLGAGQSTTRIVRFYATLKGTYDQLMSIQSNDPDQGLTQIDLHAIAFAVNELHCGTMQAASGTQQTLNLQINNMEAFVGFQFDLFLPAPLTYVSGSALLNPARSNGHQVIVSMVNATTLRVIGFSASNQAFNGNEGMIVSLDFEVNGTGGWYPLSLGNVIIGDETGDNIESASYGGGLTITAPDIHASNSINFGNVAVNSSGIQNLTIYNYGQEELTIESIVFTDGIFSLVNTLPVTIQPWNSQQISIHFQPQTTGQATGQMRIFSDDPDETPFIVELNGHVYSPNYLTVASVNGVSGTTVTLPISVENFDPFVGFQFDLVLPEGSNYVASSAVLDPSRKQDHVLSVSTLGNGTIRVLAFSMQQLPFLGNEGTIVTLQINLEQSLSIGNHEVQLQNGILGDNQSQNILWEMNNGFIRIPATITSISGEGGTINPIGSIMVYYGESQHFVITANEGYGIANVLVDGVSVGAVGSYTFSNVTANHTIAASFNLLTYTLTASAGTGGSISPQGIITVNYGGNQTFNITANTGYEIANVLVDGVSVGVVGSYTFSNVTANHTIAASFNLLTYTLTASAGTGGSISPQGTITVNYGGSQTFNITANTGYEIANVLVDGVSVGAVGSYTFSNVTANHTIAASFNLLTYTLTASAGTGGSISPQGTITVNYGGSQTFNVTANTGYEIANVLVDGVSVGAVGSYTFNNVTANHTIAASFNLLTYTLTASAGTGGSISPQGTITVNYGGSQTFNITANTGYEIANVLVDGVSVGAIGSYTFSNVTANHTIAASFNLLTYTLTASAGTGGSISPQGTITVNYGGSQTFNITANTGFEIANVLVDGVSVGAVGSYTFSNVTANHTIAASFNLLTYTLTASAGTGGSISPQGTITVNYGGSQTFNITTNTGYEIANVLVDGVSVGAVGSYTFSNVTANHTIAASFNLLTFTLTASAGTGGSISPQGTITVNYGGIQTFNITANTGYEIANVLVDGVSVGAVGSYTFSNVTANHTIAASFSILTYAITATSGPNGTITPSGIVQINYGESQTFTFQASEGYQVYAFWVDGDSIGNGESYTFSNIVSNHDIHVQFSLIIGIDEENLIGTISGWPNPTTDWFFLQTEKSGLETGRIEIVLSNIKGKTLWRDQKNETLKKVPLHGLKPGLYFIHLFYEGSLVKSMKVIKM